MGPCIFIHEDHINNQQHATFYLFLCGFVVLVLWVAVLCLCFWMWCLRSCVWRGWLSFLFLDGSRRKLPIFCLFHCPVFFVVFVILVVLWLCQGNCCFLLWFILSKLHLVDYLYDLHICPPKTATKKKIGCNPFSLSSLHSLPNKM